MKKVSHREGPEYARWFCRRLGLQDRIVEKPINVFEQHIVHCDHVLFRRAKIIIRPHGGDLANIAYSPAGTHVVEFVPISRATLKRPYYKVTHFYGLAQSAGHHHWVVEPENFEFNQPDMRVEADEVVGLVDKILSDTRFSAF